MSVQGYPFKVWTGAAPRKSVDLFRQDLCVSVKGRLSLHLYLCCHYGPGLFDVWNWCYSHKSCVSCRERTSPDDLNPYAAVQERGSVQGNTQVIEAVRFEHVPISPCLMLCLCSNTSLCKVRVCCYWSHKPISNGNGIRRKFSLFTSCSITACFRALVFFLCSTEYQLLLTAGY